MSLSSIQHEATPRLQQRPVRDEPTDQDLNIQKCWEEALNLIETWTQALREKESTRVSIKVPRYLQTICDSNAKISKDSLLLFIDKLCILKQELSLTQKSEDKKIQRLTIAILNKLGPIQRAIINLLNKIQKENPEGRAQLRKDLETLFQFSKLNLRVLSQHVKGLLSMELNHQFAAKIIENCHLIEQKISGLSQLEPHTTQEPQTLNLLQIGGYDFFHLIDAAFQCCTLEEKLSKLPGFELYKSYVKDQKVLLETVILSLLARNPTHPQFPEAIAYIMAQHWEEENPSSKLFDYAGAQTVLEEGLSALFEDDVDMQEA